MSVTMKDVARMAGVSSATVSHVINKSRHVNGKTHKKVMKAVHELNYNINFVARNLRRGTSKLVGFIVSNMADYFFTTVANGVEAVLKDNGYNLLLVNADEKKAVEMAQSQMLFNHSVAGVIIAPATEECGYLDHIFGKDFPIVFLDRMPTEIERDVVLASNTKGVCDAVSFLIQKGHRRIAFLSTHIMDVTMAERFSGYKTALERFDISFDMSLVRIGDEDPKINHDLMTGQGYNFMQDIFKHTDATAVFMGNNLSAMGGYYYLKESGYLVPDEMAVVAFDDSLWTSMTTPPVTVVRQPGVDIGKHAAQLLINRIRGDGKPFEEVRLPTSLILRGSC